MPLFQNKKVSLGNWKDIFYGMCAINRPLDLARSLFSPFQVQEGTRSLFSRARGSVVLPHGATVVAAETQMKAAVDVAGRCG